MVSLAGEIVGLTMDLETARQHVARINEHLDSADHHINQARKLIWELREQEGWRALGYPSWRQCIMQEFNRSAATVYRQLDAALVELELSPSGRIGDINERVLRPLTKRNFDTEARQGIWAIANEIVGEGGKVTSGVVEVVIETVKEILVSGATQDGDEMHPLTERVHAQIVEAVREKKIAHKEHIRRMDKQRDYILGGCVIVEAHTEFAYQGWGEQLCVSVALNELDAQKFNAAKKSGKPIYISLWTEE